jgi:hypothetical protein
MRLLRNKFLSKFLAVFLLITILESTIHATVSLALTTGPHQPEYTSYESADATDMVNLLTGDFTFNLPILEVPGPDGGFSVPLTYNAGIGVDQEASWVGLGWTLAQLLGVLFNFLTMPAERCKVLPKKIWMACEVGPQML